jgi:hypothetical protein
MDLKQIEVNGYTDKNTVHSYLDTYNKIFENKRLTANNVLEIGIGDFKELNGGSLLLWKRYFINAIIYGLDILPLSRVMDEVKKDDKIILYTSTDAYNQQFFNDNIKDKKFDILIDDGPHTV